MYGCGGGWVNSTSHSVYFCLHLGAYASGPPPAATVDFVLDGYASHGPGSSSSGVYLTSPANYAGVCPSSTTWYPPEGTGALHWPFNNTVRIAALD